MISALQLVVCAQDAQAQPAKTGSATNQHALIRLAAIDKKTIDSTGPGIERIKDIKYGAHRMHTYDVYRSPDASNAPILMLVHGGAWRFGDKSSKTLVANKVARWLPRGFIVVSANYRLLPAADPITQASDVARALASIQRNADKFGGDASRIVMVGHSAGAQITALLSASPTLANAAGARRWLGSVSLDTAALNIERIMAAPHRRFYDAAFGGDPGYWRQVSATLQVSKRSLPLMLVCSSLRQNSCQQAHHYAQAANRLSVSASVYELALSHRAINGHLGLPSAYTQAVEAYLSGLDAELTTRLSAGH